MSMKLFKKVLQIFSGRNIKRLLTAPSTCDTRQKCETKIKFTDKSRPDMEKLTHTGQVWAKDDYRNVRFMHAKRHVNDTWGIKVTHAGEWKVCNERVIACEGSGPLGHPKFFMNLDKPGPHYCYYCGNSYILKGNTEKKN